MSAVQVEYSLQQLIGIMPLNAVLVSNQSSPDPEHANDYLRFFTIESESSFKLSAITRSAQNGVRYIVGYKFDATVYVPHNYYATVMREIMTLSHNNPQTEVIFVLGNDGTVDRLSDEYYINTVNSHNATALKISNCLSMVFEIESKPERPRTILTFTGTIPRSSIDSKIQFTHINTLTDL